MRGLLFDLDGTLYRKSRFHIFFLAFRLRDSLTCFKHLPGAREWLRGREFSDQAALTQAFYSELGKRSALNPDDAKNWYLNRFLPEFIRLLKRRAQIRRGLMELLGILKAKGFKMGVLSDFGALEERLRALGIDVEMFDYRASSEESGALKPMPRPFLLAAQRMGLSPAEVLVIGDREDTDGHGARAAGMAFLCTDKYRGRVRGDWKLRKSIADRCIDFPGTIFVS